jgi:hypothetical protein
MGGGPRFSERTWQRVEPHMGEIKADLEPPAPDLSTGAVT